MSTNQFKGKIVLAVGAHPDDLEFGCAGTLAAVAEGGGEAYQLILTNGEKGTDDMNISGDKLTELRRQEQRNAARALGVKEAIFFDYVDGELVNSRDLVRDIVRVIRKLKPDIVITIDPTFVYDAKRGFINHPDHRAAGQATMDAVYPFARNRPSFPELYEKEGLDVHSVGELYLMFHEGGDFVDISKVLDKKIKAIKAHTSQFGDMKDLEKWVREMGAEVGKRHKVGFGESFVKIKIR